MTACGSSSGEIAELSDGPQLVRLFNPNKIIAAGIPQRLPFGLIDNGIRLTGDGAPVPARVLQDGQVIAETDVLGRVVSHDHPPGTEEHQHSGLLRYYALRATLPGPGIYDVELDINGSTATTAVQAFDPSEIGVILPGAEFPSLLTPTSTDPAGVDPICTQPDGPCVFHDRTAADVLAAGEPMALLVATPAYCATAYCGPVLTTLLEAHADRVERGDPPIAFVHVEPYANAREVAGDLSSPDLRLAPTLAPLGLDFEPVLFLVDGAGTLVDRIDNVFDRTELDEALVGLA